MAEDVLGGIIDGPLAAHRLLRDPQVAAGLTAEQAYELTLRAGYGKGAAEAAARAKALARLRRGEQA